MIIGDVDETASAHSFSGAVAVAMAEGIWRSNAEHSPVSIVGLLGNEILT